MAKKRKKKKLRLIWKFVILATICVLLINIIPEVCRRYIYPKDSIDQSNKYSEFVSKYSKEYNIDENFIYAVIKTESNFNPNAVSDVGAKGLMQVMEDAYKWVKTKLCDDRKLTYNNMFEPEYNIQYGTYLLSYLYKEFGSYELAAAAYHAGRTSVNNWIDNGIIDKDKLDIDDIPSDVTRYYVKKIMRSFRAYSNLYS